MDRTPQALDESKTDIVYVLPLFAKPGNHQYIIKFKNSSERYQRRLLSKIRKAAAKEQSIFELK